MKLKTPLICATLSLLGLYSGFGTPIVDFHAENTNLKNNYIDPARAADTKTSSVIRWNHRTDDGGALLNQGNPATVPAVYGGLEIANSSGSAWGYFRLHDNSPAAWPNKPLVFVQAPSSNSSVGTVKWLNLWRKDQFLNGGAEGTIQFNASSILSVDSDSTNGSTTIRFVIKDSGVYYISEFSAVLNTPATVALADFNNNAAAGKRWGIFHPAGTDFGIPNPLPEFEPKGFGNVEEVGFILQGQRGYAATYGYNNVRVDAAVTTPMDVGMNLNGVNDYMADHPFVDALKKARNFMTRNADGTGSWATTQEAYLPRDANGWPTQVPFTPPSYPPQIVHTLVTVCHPGTYTLIYEGVGTFKYAAASGTNWTTVTETSGGTKMRTVNVQLMTTGKANFYLEIHSSGGGDYLRNFRLVTPGYESVYQTQPFHPDYLQRLENFSTLRFMDWGNTNWNPSKFWADRTLETSNTQSRDQGVAYEYMVKLANTLHKNLWICVPYAANDEFVAQLAGLLRDTLDPGLKIWVEYGNETWNTGFRNQVNYVQDMGQSLALDPNRWIAGQKYVSLQSAHIFDIFESEFGAEASDRLLKVMATQTANTSLTSDRLNWLLNPQLNPSGIWPDVLAIGPYFGGSVADQIVTNGEVDSITVEEILERCQTDMETTVLTRVDAQKQLADEYGLWLVCYEGGQHLAGTSTNANIQTLTDKLTAANRSPLMRELYVEYHQLLADHGLLSLNHYAYIGEYNKWGSWGVVELVTQQDEVLHKYNGILDWLEASPTGNRPPKPVLAMPETVVDTDNNGRQAVTLGAGESLDIDGTVVEYLWKSNGVSIGNGEELTVELPVGQNLIELSVRDDGGLTGTISDVLTITPPQ